MSQSAQLDIHNTGGHAFFLYDNPESRVSLLANYFAQGLANGELCIFVTPGTPEYALHEFELIGFDASKSFDKKDLRIFEMNATYLPDGNFVADFMLNNVRLFIEEAQTQGYKGIRTAGEMSWLADHPEAIDESMRYEQSVNQLQTPGTTFTGLCLYSAQESFTQILRGAAHSHPTFIDGGRVHTNPHYITS